MTWDGRETILEFLVFFVFFSWKNIFGGAGSTGGGAPGRVQKIEKKVYFLESIFGSL